MGSEAQWDKSATQGGFLRDPTDGFDSSDFRRLAEHLTHMVWICKPDGSLDYMNPHGQGYFGKALRDALALFPSGPLSHADDRERSRVAWQHAIQSQEPLGLEMRLQRADGAFRWHLIRAEPVRHDSGRVIKWMGTCTNVHSLKEGNELSAFLLELSTEFARLDNPHELVATAMFRLRQHLGAAQVTLAEYDYGRAQAVMLRQDRRGGPDLQVLNLPLGPFESITAEARNGVVTALNNVPANQ